MGDNFHRANGPAVNGDSGNKYWMQNNEYHRLDGPAIEHSNGAKEWFQYGKSHRLDGAAVEYPNGFKIWSIENERYSKDEFNKIINLINNDITKL